MAEQKFIFIQFPDDVDDDSVSEVLELLHPIAQKMVPQYTFVAMPEGYKVWDVEDIKEFIAELATVVT